MSTKLPEVRAEDIKKRLNDTAEFALLDVREPGPYADGHPFFVVNIPYSRLEPLALALIPNKGVDIVLVDANDGVAEKAARRLGELGYTSVAKLAGGVQSWQAAGFELFDGVNLPSKTFGEIVEEELHTPRITAEQLEQMRRSGEDFILLDGRTPEEFTRMSIPGGRSCPNAELGHRLPAIDPSEQRTVVVNCAGRTRSIIGAQSLINQGFTQRIVALENGTQGWQLAGLTLDRGLPAAPLPELDDAQLQASRRRAASMRARFGINTIDMATLQRWQDEPQSLYLLDVRSAEEYASGHIAGSRHAPGGQLVQSTDSWVGVRGARIVLIDSTGLRATNSAVWLKGMSHQVFVLDTDVTQLEDVVAGPDIIGAAAADEFAPQLVTISASQLAQELGSQSALIDLRSSQAYREQHLAGAVWSIRPKLASLAETLSARRVVLISDELSLARLAAKDLREVGIADIVLLADDLEAWGSAGLETQSSSDSPPDSERIDFIFHTHQRHHGNLDAARAYLSWETGLIERLDEHERDALQPVIPTS